MRKTPKKRSRTPLLIGIILLALIAAAGGTWLINRNKNQTPASTNPTVMPEGYINYNPPTKEEKQQAEENKKELSGQTDKAEATTNGKATPVITYAGFTQGNAEVAGYVQGVIEDGGTCKYTFKQDSKQITKETPGTIDAAHTTCTPIKVPRSEFPASGSWKVTLSYSSAKASGTSGEQTLTIQ